MKHLTYIIAGLMLLVLACGVSTEDVEATVEARIASIPTPTPLIVIVEEEKEGVKVVKEGEVEVIKEIQKQKKDSKIVMLTGYGNIPTAVAAVKAGAVDYIPKPADADDVENALLALPDKKAKPPENPMSADRVKWEHIHRIFELCNRNVSETARRLKMHRRTLQRILSKRSPR